MGAKESAYMNAKKLKETIDLALALAVIAYILYGKTTGDSDLEQLKAHGRYYWWKVKLWYKHKSEPAWKKELRMYFTVVPNPVPSVAGEDGVHAG